MTMRGGLTARGVGVLLAALASVPLGIVAGAQQVQPDGGGDPAPTWMIGFAGTPAPPQFNYPQNAQYDLQVSFFVPAGSLLSIGALQSSPGTALGPTGPWSNPGYSWPFSGYQSYGVHTWHMCNQATGFFWWQGSMMDTAMNWYGPSGPYGYYHSY